MWINLNVMVLLWLVVRAPSLPHECSVDATKTTPRAALTPLAVALFVGVQIGAFFYMSIEEWGFHQALFYAVNVGLGIGYKHRTVMPLLTPTPTPTPGREVR